MSGVSSVLSGNRVTGVIKTVSSAGALWLLLLLALLFFFPFRVDLVTHTLLFFFFDFLEFGAVGAGRATPLELGWGNGVCSWSEESWIVREESCFCFLGGGSSSSLSFSLSLSFSWDFRDSERSSEASVSVLLPFCRSLDCGLMGSASGSSVVGSLGSMASLGSMGCSVVVIVAVAVVVGFDSSSSSSSSSL